MDHHSTQSRKAPVDGLWDFTYGRRTCWPRVPHSSCLPTFPRPWLRMDPGDPSGDPVGDAAGTPADGQDPLLFLQALRTLWSTREWQQLREEAWRGFAALRDPRAGLLAMLESSQGRQGTGPTLEVWVACELSCWLQARPCPGLAQGSPGLKQLQARAVRVLAKSTPRLVEPLVSIFQLQDAERRPLLAHIHQLHQDGKFKEAVMLGTKLQPELDVEKMCTLLLLQDKASLVERYVAGFPDLQRMLLALMDSWCWPGFDIRTVSRRLLQVTPRRLEKLSPRALTRQVLGLREKYGLDPALCPNAATQQRLAALRFLCCKRFVERTMSQENWADCVQGLVGQSPWLQEQLVQLLASHGDMATAVHCAPDLSLPKGRLPATVAAELSCLRLQESALCPSRPEALGGTRDSVGARVQGCCSSAPPRPAGGPSADRTDGHYQLPIARRDIHFLASWGDLASHEEELLQPGRVVGVDVEWRPSFGMGGRPRPSLMQLAVEGHVFLLDLPVFLEPAGGLVTQAFSQLVSRLLLDPSITKLGYGMTGDLRSLGTSCPALAHVEKQLQGGLDLLQVHRQMRMADEPVRGVARAGGPRGLSLLVQQVLGKPLDKTQQLSNWDRRPLSEEQLVYAAADAYCLLEVYQALCREPARFLLLDNLARSPRPGHSKRSGAGELPGWQEASAPALQVPVAKGEGTAPAVPARAFRVVCDNMLQGLARSLRCLGVDTLMLGTGEDHRRAAEVARQEERVILTSGLPYHKLRAQVGAGRCLQVDCSLKARQQAKAVLRHFNVHVTHADIFSRCQACNCDQYLKVSKNLMRQLMWPSGHQEGPSSIGQRRGQPWAALSPPQHGLDVFKAQDRSRPRAVPSTGPPGSSPKEPRPCPEAAVVLCWGFSGVLGGLPARAAARPAGVRLGGQMEVTASLGCRRQWAWCGGLIHSDPGCS
ncbi:exonuclease mut-7 homolog isoform X2 [Manis pentadactyla]|uniref:exonuclease mut-7 homolog isoform X2 n=1 Tax=Manis pentadactyla TaxID=143292 RepID=UPI00255CD291|nr:exonuclease mut-7 homolog isoform X2 [Manis pentadactyla]